MSRMPDRYEMVNGQVVDLPPPNCLAAEVANRLRDEMVLCPELERLGRTRMGMLFRVPVPGDPGRCRHPSVAFVSFERWPLDRPIPYHGDEVDAVPDVVAEVVGPDDTAEGATEKHLDYLRAGVRLVWVVYPSLRLVFAFTQVSGPNRVFNEADTLDGGDVLPGFAASMNDLFPAVIDVPEPRDDLA